MTTTARDKLIESAIGLMRTHGVSGTTVADLLSDSGVARRSLYLNFPQGRGELLGEAAQTAGTAMSEGLAAVLADAREPIVVMRTLLTAVGEGLAADDYDAGCPVVASALGGRDAPAARESACGTFELWLNVVEQALVTAGVPAQRAPSLAALMVSSVEGAVILCIAQRSTTPLDHVANELEQLLDTVLDR
ncbi:TetR/AcrR family transcriptional regulator [Streptomyces sp. NA04227]|uniref:TetR/AcrR family transcriptional regulator n=1 Tax=Streptomyces sp. NA04227 TaxID=2742136 RepID=UPI0015911EBE|nr:TetR family transcriptional regulator [Streptomyces sp. NA04227]QKW08421.1 TetR/AcrR family transcriptional regulator [Streptomyces sp. NA04227]